MLMFFLIGACMHAAPSLPSLDWIPGSDWINVKDFGAKGDGKTDDTAALQKAFNKLANHTTIYLPPGRYIISEMLVWKGEKRLLGVTVIGHGKDTVLEWRGEKGGKMIMDGGITLSRYVGFELDGNNSAAIGIWHHNHNFFETNIRKRFIAVRNVTEIGICFEKNSIDGLSTAEITFENCIFENCNTGVSFVSFNDYNYSFEGCFFAKNRYGIFGEHCNFYVRECRFEDNQTDIHAKPEHMCSVRRTVSTGSGVFLDYNNSVSPMTVENCYVADWKGEAAILSAGAPLTVFDCTFKGKSTPVKLNNKHQKIVVSENTVIGGGELLNLAPVDLVVIPAGKRKAMKLGFDINFLKSTVKTPKFMLDAVKDFGAKGNGKTDDTAAIQKAIDAAAKRGNGAIAYLPAGIYRTTDTLKISGKDFYFGGCGVGSKIKFDGGADKNAIEVRNPQNIVLENFSFEHPQNIQSSGGVPIEEQAPRYGADIMQFGSDKPSFITYCGVFCFGKYRENPTWYGFKLHDLTKNDQIHAKYIEGNFTISGSTGAEVLSNCSFEGTLTIEGKNGKAPTGFFGFMTRLVTLSAPCMYVKDNASVIVSDFYMEQSRKENIIMDGKAGQAPGRVSLGLAKLQKRDKDKHYISIDFNNYNGVLGVLSGQFYRQNDIMNFIAGKDAKVDMNLLGCCFYGFKYHLGSDNIKMNMAGCSFVGTANNDKAEKADEPEKFISNPAKMTSLLDDFRELGEYDMKYNYPEIHSKVLSK